MKTDNVAEMLTINVEQKKYYEIASGGETSEINSAGTNLWRKLRKRAFHAFASTDRESVQALQRAWIGDVSGAKVLDLGVGSGNPLSLELAASAREYVALDLSQSRIDDFRRKVEGAGIEKGKFYAADFLSDEFTEDRFDVIYAMAVFHHFKHLDAFLDTVSRKLAPGGRVVTYDPVNNWWLARMFRAGYRLVQTDSEWEHPFTKTSMNQIESKFEVLACQGVLGKAKYACLLSVLWPSAGRAAIGAWHKDDLRNKTTPASMRNCLHASYHLRKR